MRAAFDMFTPPVFLDLEPDFRGKHEKSEIITIFCVKIH